MINLKFISHNTLLDDNDFLSRINFVQILIIKVNTSCYCLANLSRRFKWPFLTKMCPLSGVVVLVVVIIVVKFSYFHLFIHNHWANFKTKIGTKHPWKKGIRVCSNQMRAMLFNNEIVKIHLWNLKRLLLSNYWGQPYVQLSILGWWEFKFVQIKGHAYFQAEIITEYQKYIDKI